MLRDLLAYLGYWLHSWIPSTEGFAIFVVQHLNLCLQRKRPVMLPITHKFGLVVHARFDFVRGGLDADLQGGLVRAVRSSFSISL